MPSIRHSSEREPCDTRRRRARGWSHRDAAGRAVARVCRIALELRGGTPAVCRASDFDPHVIDSCRDGRTISSRANRVEAGLGRGHSAEEVAVLALLRRGPEQR